MGRGLDDARRLDAGDRPRHGVEPVVVLDDPHLGLGQLLASDYRQALDHRRAQQFSQLLAKPRVVEGGHGCGDGQFEIELELEADIGCGHGTTRTV